MMEAKLVLLQLFLTAFISICSGSKIHVIYSIDCQSLDYALYAPLTGLVWAHRVHYDPVLLIVGTTNDFSSPRIVELMRLLDSHALKYIKFTYDDAEFDTRTLAQMSRLFAFSYFKDDDYVLVSDVDMFPISRDFFEVSGQPKDSFTELRGNATYSKRWDEWMFPMCYIGAYVDVWRKIVLGEMIDEIRKYRLENVNAFDMTGQGTRDNLRQWNMDQILIHRWWQSSGVPLYHKPNNHVKRLDKIRWDGVVIGRTDAHLLRPLTKADNWIAVMAVFRLLVGTNYYDDRLNSFRLSQCEMMSIQC